MASREVVIPRRPWGTGRDLGTTPVRLPANGHTVAADQVRRHGWLLCGRPAGPYVRTGAVSGTAALRVDGLDEFIDRGSGVFVARVVDRFERGGGSLTDVVR